MKAVCWQGTRDVRIESVPDPKIINPRDAIIKVSSTAICGSDLHLYDGFIAGMEKGDILGHEFMGEVVEMGPAVQGLQIGDRVVVPFAISCGSCHFCKRGLFASCDNSNPNAELAEKLYGQAGAGLFGNSHITGGYAGGQAEYVRVPFADVGPLKIPEGIDDERVLFLGDILPTGWMAAENCGIEPGDTVAVWGAGPVGLFAVQSAYLLGAERVIAIDRLPSRLELAERVCGADVINFEETDVLDELRLRTAGRGPDSCIDAVGLEAHGSDLQGMYDRFKTAVYLETDRPGVLRQAIQACRKSGTVSIPGVYAGLIDKMPIGAAFAKGLTLKMGPTHVHRYMKPLLELILKGELDPSFIITHRYRLDDAPIAYEALQAKSEECVKMVMKAH